MDLELTYNEKEGYLYLKLTGTLTFDRKILDDPMLPLALKKYDCARLLINIRGLHTAFDAFNRRDIGEYFGRLSHPSARVKTAVLRSPGNDDDLTATVAKTRGAALEFFTEEREALDWLLRG
jgi:hypothetical protein